MINDGRPDCFLCAPEPGLVYLRTATAFAMLAHGPIKEGYSLVATVAHDPSMLDLDPTDAAAVDDLTRTVRERLHDVYGPAVVTEHGRVAPCVAQPTQAYEPHCLHAHRLVFPGRDVLDVRALAPFYRWETFASYAELRRHGAPPGQYLACEQADGRVDIAAVTRPLARQFFRRLVAYDAGLPQLADWHRNRGDDLIASALRRLGMT
jgi:hypothetical protein